MDSAVGLDDPFFAANVTIDLYKEAVNNTSEQQPGMFAYAQVACLSDSDHMVFKNTVCLIVSCIGVFICIYF